MGKLKQTNIKKKEKIEFKKKSILDCILAESEELFCDLNCNFTHSKLSNSITFKNSRFQHLENMNMTETTKLHSRIN